MEEDVKSIEYQVMYNHCPVCLPVSIREQRAEEL